MSNSLHNPCMTNSHEAGKWPATTYLLMAVSPTPNSAAIRARPTVSAISRVSTMSAIYPPVVNNVKSTNGRLPKLSPVVDNQVMDDRPDYSHIGERIAAIRLGFSDLSQKSFAEMHSFSITQYNNWEKGRRRISVDAAQTLAGKYGLTLDYIFLGRRDGLSERASKVL